MPKLSSKKGLLAGNGLGFSGAFLLAGEFWNCSRPEKSCPCCSISGPPAAPCVTPKIVEIGSIIGSRRHTIGSGSTRYIRDRDGHRVHSPSKRQGMRGGPDSERSEAMNRASMQRWANPEKLSVKDLKQLCSIRESSNGRESDTLQRQVPACRGGRVHTLSSTASMRALSDLRCAHSPVHPERVVQGAMALCAIAGHRVCHLLEQMEAGNR
jgi:hypothetical protein